MYQDTFMVTYKRGISANTWKGKVCAARFWKVNPKGISTSTWMARITSRVPRFLLYIEGLSTEFLTTNKPRIPFHKLSYFRQPHHQSSWQPLSSI